MTQYRKGESHPGAKLTRRDVVQLRRRYRGLKADGYRVSTFVRVQASDLGVSEKTIYNAIYGYSWGHVDDA